MRWRVFSLMVLAWAVLPSVALANLDEAQFRGHDEGYEYVIHILYKPMPAFRGYPDAPKAWTVIDTLSVTLNGRSIKIPAAATADLFWPHTPEPPYGGPNKTLRFGISGGSGEYSYRVVFVFSEKGLLQRERTDHAGKEKIIRYRVR
jgi:hypothetical protein